jgi:thiamine-phosphate pyrophosphorylase
MTAGRGEVVRGFYAIVEDEALCHDLIEGGAGVIQLRVKHASTRDWVARARRVRAMTRGRVPFVVDDRCDVALWSEADGVHVGQDDVPLGAARRLMGAKLVGVSTHDLEQALAAERGGADYIGFGPVFPTLTKERPDPVTGPDTLRRVCAAVKVPVVAIGGITPANAGLVAACGASAAVSIAAVNGATDVRAAAAAVARAFGAR